MKTRYILVRTILQILLMVITFDTASSAALPIDSASRAEANTFFQNQDWKNAAARYKMITKEEANNGQAWFRLGVSLHGLSEHKEAVQPYNNAVRLGFQTTNATLRLARTYAVLGQKKLSLDALQKVVQGGFAVARQGLEMETELDNIRKEPRYATIVQQAEANLCASCNAVPESRQFDFWVGEWDVRPFATPAAAPTARSVIERTNGNCTILENYYTKGGYVGKSFNAYDAAQGKWRQFWNDNTGAVIEFVGEYDAAEKAIKYRSESVNRQGQKQLGKMTFYNLGADKVRQRWETSTDEGKTWTTAFDGLYTRRK